MKNQISKYLLTVLIIICFILLGVLIYVRFFNNNESEEYAILTEKVQGEIKYLDSSIIEMMNKLNNISYTRYQVTIKEVNESEQNNPSESNQSVSSENSGESNSGGNQQSNQESSSSGGQESTNETNQSSEQSESRTSRLAQVDSLLNSNYDDISWDEISYGVETLYTSWPSINLDMEALNLNKNDIANFSSTLDGLAQAVKIQDKNSALINLYNLYILLPRYLSNFTNDDQMINVYNAKANILSAYVSANNEDWESMNNSVTNAINELSKNMNLENVTDIEKTTLEKSYILLEELKRGIGLEDKDIFYLKYKLAMEQLEII